MTLDRNSATWLGIAKLVEARLAELRESNDNSQLTLGETNLVRGKIDFAKEILALGDDKDETQSTSADYGI